MAKTWILVGHDAGARVFENRGPGKGLELVETIEHPEGRLRDRDIDSDRPGRSFRKDSGDPRRAAMSRGESPHDRAISDFARALANKLQRARVGNQYERLVLVAPPRFLGLLRASLDGPTAQLVVGSLDKDLATRKEAELIGQLGKVIAI
ncbi:MAG: host attachment protein [Myxococcales bacterium]|jgi:protein required for attachment to host cells|nr:host attachment protein [Myxococcales bacterium]